MRSRGEHPFYGRRLIIASAIAACSIFAIVLRLWFLQCFRGTYYRDLSENNRTRTVRMVAPRGTMYDREGRVIVRNRPEFNIAIMLEDAPDIKYTLAQLSSISGVEPEKLRSRLDSSRRHRPFEPQVVLADVTFEELAKIKANSYRLPGVSVEVAPTRFYPYADLGAQLVGYAREISKNQLDEMKGSDARYRMGDIVGQSGLEKQLEDLLSGTTGFVQVEVDAMGNRKGELGIVDSRSGSDLTLTIDLDLQRAADEGLRGKRGAAVVLDPRSGEVLALSSAPSFDANIFSGETHGADWQRISQDSTHPLRNRAIGEVYPAGSTFKLILATAALAEGKIGMHTTFNCPGYYMFAGRPYHCHKRSGHGTVDLPTALAVSCNSYFYQVGQLLGISGISRYAKLLGLGVKSEIELPGEKSGVIPSEEWKLKQFGQRWYPGETVSVSIGQGYVAVTPLQMAIAVSAIANGGTVYQPLIVKKVHHSSDRIEEFSSQVERRLDVDPKVFETVRQIATGVVHDKRGTGHRAAIPGITVGGKTGTAQVAALSKGTEGHLNDHAWFVAFAPAENPEIALAVIVENGGHGGEAAAPISKQIMETYFRKRGMLVGPPAEERAKPVGTQQAMEGQLQAPDSGDSHELG